MKSVNSKINKHNSKAVHKKNSVFKITKKNKRQKIAPKWAQSCHRSTFAPFWALSCKRNLTSIECTEKH